MLQKNPSVKQAVLSHNYLYTNCTLVTKQPIDGHKNHGNMLVKNTNM